MTQTVANTVKQYDVVTSTRSSQAFINIEGDACVHRSAEITYEQANFQSERLLAPSGTDAGERVE